MRAKGWLVLRGTIIGAGVIGSLGCCFGDFAQGFQQGFNDELARTTDCATLTAAVNAASARANAVPDLLANVAEPTPQQVQQSLEPLAAACEQNANDVRLLTLTHPGISAQRDQFATYYSSLATELRAGAQAAVANDVTAFSAANARVDVLAAQEEPLVAALNAMCRQ